MALDDLRFMRRAFELARSARARGDQPFGAVLVDASGTILVEAKNSIVTQRDCTAHAELNCMREASRTLDRDLLARCTLYASAEPCAMCAAAIFWGNVRRVVYGLSKEALYELVGDDTEEVLYITCRDILGRGKKTVEVVGPLLQDEAREVHAGFWR